MGEYAEKQSLFSEAEEIAAEGGHTHSPRIIFLYFMHYRGHTCATRAHASTWQTLVLFFCNSQYDISSHLCIDCYRYEHFPIFLTRF